MKCIDWRLNHADPHLSLYEIVYSNRSGERCRWSLASREKTGPKCMTGRLGQADAVVIVPYHRAREQLVVIREYRVALGGFQLGFPAGLIDTGETIEQAAARELTEETGLTVVAHMRSSPALFTSSGLTDEAVVMAYVACAGQPSAAGNSDSELIETLFVGRAAAAQLCQASDTLMDVKTWLVLDAFAAHGKL